MTVERPEGGRKKNISEADVRKMMRRLPGDLDPDKDIGRPNADVQMSGSQFDQKELEGAGFQVVEDETGIDDANDPVERLIRGEITPAEAERLIRNKKENNS